jgi:hypothetical protein
MNREEVSYTKKLERKIELFRRINQQHKWIYQHGSNLAGYLDYYREDDDPFRGAPIWQADLAELVRLEEELRACT